MYPVRSGLWLLILMSCGLAQAASIDDEKRELAAINDQFGKLEYLVQRAERNADYRQSRQFDYHSLRSDIRDVQSGIDAYLNPTRPEPASVQPLGGDYIMRIPTP
ncbi:hypothetical protein C9J12_21160 [Photobacterium frigidiphilum]|uniref:Conjugal transfer protein n=1 Tax=Photobacterium frigidiphilum TaxID=264736 RepID=A0A2T3JAE2_9GAMM|nr:RAQPRD family integrative conjugative element protein [Photobacterium frigidiphilum]PSU45754.1 hypothetical protein C9J12_21160 [Photobacterium frigidiphilum]